MNIECVLPTRGLIYARTIKGLLENIDAEHINIISELPMPDCFNQGVKKALEKGADYVWFVEEDNGVPRRTLESFIKLAEQGHKIITIDYKVGKNSHINNGWCGLGCTMIAREVFENIPEPWFEVDKHLNYKDGDYEILNIDKDKVGNKFGGHDALFFYHKARPLGYTITVAEGQIEHYRCKEVPKRELNNGFYSISSL